MRRFEERYAESVWELHNVALNDVGAHVGNGPWDADLRSIPSVYLDAGGEFLIGLVEGRLVAMGGLRRMRKGVAELKRMRVHPAFQRRGFGRAVLAELEHRANALGYRTLRLDTTVAQTPARRLYESAGYRQTGRGKFAGFDVLYFEKQL